MARFKEIRANRLESQLAEEQRQVHALSNNSGLVIQRARASRRSHSARSQLLLLSFPRLTHRCFSAV